MKDSNQRLHFLNSYRTHLRHELNQMGYGRATPIAVQETADAPDHVTSALAVAAMILMFASVFLVQ
jgi:hypothetical protein